MWTTQPSWSDADLAKIHSPVLIADGDHDEAIRRDHLEYVAATIPGAGLLILTKTSHFAFIQDPLFFNTAVEHFLDEK
ncbi:putative hydrolase, alpha/beta hydrolase fold family [Pseudomonas savastanoi pv. glycinea]|nr:putative hydrolase, alpha/beta hydrolase fold family [Pseudomonas savastanoi pv. glycinea]